MEIYLALDPETDRVTAQTRRFEREVDFPPGPRGDGWPLRRVDVRPEVWEATLEAGLSPNEQDLVHRAWWESGTPEGE